MSAGKRIVRVWAGEKGIEVGRLVYQADAQRETLAFSYAPSWVETGFVISPDLPLVGGYQSFSRKIGSVEGFPAAVSEAEPDGWGKRVIRRLARSEKSPLPKTSLDFLLGVEDTTRIGALRFSEGEKGEPVFLKAAAEDAPSLLQLETVAGALKAVEKGREAKKEILFLSGLGTSLGGMRPKCSFLEKGQLFIGKFPSVQDERNVVRGEMLALELARHCRLHVANARLCQAGKALALVVERFDRTRGGRIPFLSAGGMLSLGRSDEFSYEQMIQVINQVSVQPQHDRFECWKRMMFNLLISNVDDHARNHGFLYNGHGKWRLSPAYDLNPFPEKERVLKTALYEDGTPVDNPEEALGAAQAFGVSLVDAKEALAHMTGVLSKWKTLAQSNAVGMTSADLADFAPAFDASVLRQAQALTQPQASKAPNRKRP